MAQADAVIELDFLAADGCLFELNLPELHGRQVTPGPSKRQTETAEVGGARRLGREGSGRRIRQCTSREGTSSALPSAARYALISCAILRTNGRIAKTCFVEELDDTATLDCLVDVITDEGVRGDDECRFLHAEIDLVAVAKGMQRSKDGGAGVQILGRALDAFKQDLLR